MTMYKLKRIYEEPSNEDGLRVLVDRLWPRGVSKERAALDLWLKEIAPTHELRKWFDHKPELFAEFAGKYRQELDGNPAVVELRSLAEGAETVTLLSAAGDLRINHTVVLKQILAEITK